MPQDGMVWMQGKVEWVFINVYAGKWFGDSLVGLLTTDHEVTGLIPGTSTNFKCAVGLERGTPSLVKTIG